MKMSEPISIAGEIILPDEEKFIRLNVAKLYDFTDLSIPICVLHGKYSGPKIFISSTIHGDEINGVEIIRQLINKKLLPRLRGTLILVPVINVYGYNNKSRYLPDRRDLNRSFPGSKKGSFASRLAYTFMKEIVSQCQYGIDLHTAAINYNNLPQIRTFFHDSKTLELAKAFNAPITLASNVRDGSLRESAQAKGVRMLLYEGGQALRHDQGAIKIGLRGCLSVLRYIGMLGPLRSKSMDTILLRGSIWFRAPHSGSINLIKKLGDTIQKNDLLAIITDIFGREKIEIKSTVDGILIGCCELPLVNQGDALFHIATLEDSKQLKKYQKSLIEESINQQ